MREVKRIQKLANEVGLLEAELKAKTKLLRRKRKDLERRMIKKGLAVVLWKDTEGKKSGVVKFREEKRYWIKNHVSLAKYINEEISPRPFLEFLLRAVPRNQQFFAALIRWCGTRVLDFLVKEHVGTLKVIVTKRLQNKVDKEIKTEWADKVKRELIDPTYVVVDFHKAKTGEVRPWYR